MSREIDYRVVEMQFNNEQFERGAKQSMSTLEKLRNTLDFSKAGDSLTNLGKTANSITFKGLSTAVSTVGEGFSILEKMANTALDHITRQAVTTGERLLKSLSVEQLTAGWTKYEQKTGSVQTIMNATGKSIDEVNGYLDRLMWFSDETSYGFTDMTQALGQLTTAGGDIEKLIPMITGIANATAYAGKGSAEFSRSIYNLNQSYSSGHLQFMDWKSLQLAGVASNALMETFIKTGIALGKIKEGEVTINNFGETLKDKWADQEVMEQAFGAFSELSDAAYEMVQRGEVQYASEAMDILTGKFSDLSEKAFKAAQQSKSFTDAIEATKDAVSSGWMKSFELIFGNYEEGVELWSSFGEVLWEIFASGSEARNEMLQEWKDLGGRTSLLDGIANVYNAVAAAVGSVKEAFRDIFPRMTSETLYSITKRFEEFTKKLAPSKKLLEDIKYVAKGIISLIATGKNVVTSAARVGLEYIKKILDASSPVTSALRNLAVNLSTVFQALYNYTSENDTFFKFFSEATAKAINLVSEAVKTLWEYLSKLKIGSHLREVLDWFEKLFKIFTADYGSISGLSKFVSDNEVLNSIIGSLTDGAEDAYKNKNRLSNVIDRVGKSILNLFHVQKNKPLESIVKTISDAEDKFHGTTVLGGLISGVSKSLKDLTTNAGKSGKNFFGTLSTNVKELNTQIQDKTQKKNILDEISESMKDLQNGGIQKGINKLQDGLIAMNETLKPTEKKTNKTPIDIVRESMQSIHRLSGKYLSGNAIKEGLADAGEFINMLNSGSEGNGYDPITRLHLFTRKLSDQYGGMSEFIDKYQVVMDIINGKYGNGAERDAKLAELGISDEQVQKYGVNVVWGLDGKWKDGYEGVLESFKGVNAALNGGKGSSQKALKLFNKISTKALAKATDINARIARLEPNTFIEELITAMENLPTVIEKVVTWFGELKTRVIASLPYLNRILGAIVGIIVVLVNQVVTYVPKIFGILGKFKDRFLEVFEAITGFDLSFDSGDGFLSAFADWIEGFYGDVVVFFDKLPERIDSFTTSVQEGFGNFIKTVDYIFGTSLSNITWEDFLTFLSETSTAIQAFVVSIPSNLASVMTDILDFFFPPDVPDGENALVELTEDDTPQTSLQRMIEFLKNAVDKVKELYGMAKGALADLWMVFFPDTVVDEDGSIWESVKDTFFSGVQYLIDHSGEFFEFLKKLPANGVDLINRFFSIFYPQKSPEEFGSIEEYTEYINLTPFERLIDNLKSLWGSAKKLFGKVKDIILDVLNYLFPDNKTPELVMVAGEMEEKASSGGFGGGTMGGRIHRSIRMSFEPMLNLAESLEESTPLMDRIINKAKEIFESVKKFVKGVWDWFYPGIEWLIDILPAFKDLGLTLFDNAKNNLSRYAGYLDAFLGDNIVEFVGNIWDLILRIKNALVAFGKFIEDNAAVIIGFVAIYGPKIYALAHALGAFLTLWHAKRLVGNLAGMIRQVKLLTRSIKYIGLIGAITGLISVLAVISVLVDPDKLIKVALVFVGVFSAVMLVLSIFEAVMNHFYNAEKDAMKLAKKEAKAKDGMRKTDSAMKQFASSILYLAVSLGIIVIAVKAFAKLDKDQMTLGLGRLLEVIGVLAGIVIVVDIIDALLSALRGSKSSGTSHLKDIALTFLAITGSAMIVLLAIKEFDWLLKDMPSNRIWEILGYLGVILGALGLMTVILNKFGTSPGKSGLGAAAAILSVAISMLLLIPAIKTMSDIYQTVKYYNEPWKRMATIFIPLIGVILAIGGAARLAQGTGKGAFFTLVALIIGVSIVVSAVEKMMAVVSVFKTGWEQIISLMGGIAIIITAFGATIWMMKATENKVGLWDFATVAVMLYGVFEIGRILLSMLVFPADRIGAAGGIMSMLIFVLGVTLAILSATKFSIGKAIATLIGYVGMAVAMAILIESLRPVVELVQQGWVETLGSAVGLLVFLAALGGIGATLGWKGGLGLVGLSAGIIVLAFALGALYEIVSKFATLFGLGVGEKIEGLAESTNKINTKNLTSSGSFGGGSSAFKSNSMGGLVSPKKSVQMFTAQFDKYAQDQSDEVYESMTEAYANPEFVDYMGEYGYDSGYGFTQGLQEALASYGVDTSQINFNTDNWMDAIPEEYRQLINGEGDITSNLMGQIQGAFGGEENGVIGYIVSAFTGGGEEAAQQMLASFQAWADENGAAYGYRAGEDTIGGWLQRVLEGQEEGIGASDVLSAFANYMDTKGITIFGKTGTELINTLKEKFGEGNLNAAATKVLRAFKGFAEGKEPNEILQELGGDLLGVVGTGMESGNVVDIITGVIKKLAGDSGFGDKGLVTALLGPAGESIIGSLADLFVNPEGLIKDAFTDAGEGLVGSLVKLIDPDAEDGKPIADSIIGAITSAVGLEEVSISEIGKKIGGGIVEGVKTKILESIPSLQALVAKLVLDIWGPRVREALFPDPDTWGTDTLAEMSEQAIEEAQENLMNGVARKSVTIVADDIHKKAYAQLYDEFGQAVEGGMQELPYDAGNSTLARELMYTNEAIQDFLTSGVLNDLGVASEDLYIRLVTGSSETAETIKKTWEVTGNEVIVLDEKTNARREAEMRKHNAIMLERQKELWPKIRQIFSTEGDTTINKLSAIGHNMVQGLVDALNSSPSYQKIRNAASNLWNQFKETFTSKKNADEHSPSKAMYRIGDYAVQGYVNAIDDGGTSVANAATNMWQNMYMGMQDGLDTMKGIANGSLAVDPSIRPVIDMSSINSSAYAINSILSNQRVRLQGDIPNIANEVAGHYDGALNQNAFEIASLRGEMAELKSAITGMQIYLDGDSVVGGIINRVDASMGRQMIYAGRSN